MLRARERSSSVLLSFLLFTIATGQFIAPSIPWLTAPSIYSGQPVYLPNAPIYASSAPQDQQAAYGAFVMDYFYEPPATEAPAEDKSLKSRNEDKMAAAIASSGGKAAGEQSFAPEQEGGIPALGTLKAGNLGTASQGQIGLGSLTSSGGGAAGALGGTGAAGAGSGGGVGRGRRRRRFVY